MINPKFGSTYEISPAMRNFIDNLTNPKYLKYGLAIFKTEFVFGKNYQSIIDNFYQTSLKKLERSPNSMHKYGAENIIDKTNLDLLINKLSPFIIEYFGINPNKKLLLYSDFTVHYGNFMDTKLDEHIDDSDITVNICLKNNLKNTGLVFTQILNTLFSKASYKKLEIDLDENDILIHSGKQSHKVINLFQDDIKENNERVNLILWFKLI